MFGMYLVGGIDAFIKAVDEALEPQVYAVGSSDDGEE